MREGGRLKVGCYCVVCAGRIEALFGFAWVL